MRSFRDSVAYEILAEEGRERGLAEGRERGLAEGRVEGRLTEARRLLVALGNDRLGAPDAATRAAVESIDDLDTLEHMVRNMFTATTWQDLLAEAPGS